MEQAVIKRHKGKFRAYVGRKHLGTFKYRFEAERATELFRDAPQPFPIVWDARLGRWRYPIIYNTATGYWLGKQPDDSWIKIGNGRFHNKDCAIVAYRKMLIDKEDGRNRLERKNREIMHSYA